jgi:hypothetical protein
MPKGQLTAENAAMVFTDHQTGLMLGMEETRPFGGCLRGPSIDSIRP